jgi:probable HAF family extracellular repeat protein
MKSRTLMCVSAITLFAALALPVRLAGQHTHYKLIDLGTLGGPNSATNGSPPSMINNRGVVAGMADTTAPCGYLGGVLSPAVKWEKGVAINLGLLPGGCFSLPNSINGKGMIVGSGDIGVLDPVWGPVIRADFRYKGHVIDLGTFGGNNSLANEINERGQITGGAETLEPDPWGLLFQAITGLPAPTTWHAALWQARSKLDLGTLGGPDSFGIPINENGQIAGFSFVNSTPNSSTGIPTIDPFFWDKSIGMIDAGTLGGTIGIANGLNNRGQVVGFSDLAGDIVNHAFISENGVIRDIGTLGGDNSVGNWINDAGQVAGISDLADGTHHAFVWKDGNFTDLGTVGSDPCSNTEYINERGQLIGTSTDCHGTILHIFLWENGSIIDLSSQVLPGSGFVLLEPVVINEAGEIVANGILPSGDNHAVLLKPCSNDCGARVTSSLGNGSIASQAATKRRTALLEKAHSSPLERVRAQMRYRYSIPEMRGARQ